MSREPSAAEVRIANVSDVDALKTIINAAFSVEKFFVQGDRIDIAEVRRLLERGAFLVAEFDGALVGCVYFEPKAERGYLGLLSVDPLRQKSGIGRLLMEAAEAHAQSIGCKAIDLRTVNLRTELPPFYRALGYVETGTEEFPKDVPTTLPCHFILMSKPLA